MSWHEGDSQGKPPKGAEEIRAALESVHREVDRRADTGPQAGGLAPDDPLVIASFYDREVGRRLQQRLLGEGIMSKISAAGRQWMVEVDAADRQRAAELLATFRLECPDKVPQGRRRLFDGVFLGAALGATAGFIGLGLSMRSIRDPIELHSVLQVLLFTVFGAMAAGLAFGSVDDWRRSGRLQFGVRDMMFLAVLVALLACLWRLQSTGLGG